MCKYCWYRWSDHREVWKVRMTYTCSWVEVPAGQQGGPKYCDKPTSWQIEDGDDPGARQYHAFCEEHQKKVDSMKAWDDNGR